MLARHLAINVARLCTGPLRHVALPVLMAFFCCLLLAASAAAYQATGPTVPPPRPSQLQESQAGQVAPRTGQVVSQTGQAVPQTGQVVSQTGQVSTNSGQLTTSQPSTLGIAGLPITLQIELLAAAVFGVIIGWFASWISSRRSDGIQLSEASAVIGLLAGPGILTVFSQTSGLFGIYAVGLFVGYFGYLFLVFLLIVRGSEKYSLDWFIDSRPRDMERGSARRSVAPSERALAVETPQVALASPADPGTPS